MTVKLVGEHLGINGCGQYKSNTNSFAATIEDAAGNPAGLLASDTGQSKAACPADASALSSGTTLMYKDCRVVAPRNGLPQGTQQWTFQWTAPAVGSGAVTIFAGVVDGDCSMNTLGDDVMMLSMSVSEGSPGGTLIPPVPTGQGKHGPSSGGLLVAAMVALSALGWRWRRRGRIGLAR